MTTFSTDGDALYATGNRCFGSNAEVTTAATCLAEIGSTPFSTLAPPSRSVAPVLAAGARQCEVFLLAVAIWTHIWSKRTKTGGIVVDEILFWARSQSTCGMTRAGLSPISFPTRRALT